MYKLTLGYFFRDVQNFHTSVAAWMVEMESTFERGKNLMEDLNNKCVLFIQVISDWSVITKFSLNRFLCSFELVYRLNLFEQLFMKGR